MKNRDIKTLAIYICNNYTGEISLLNNWIFSNAKILCQIAGCQEEDIYETIGDPSTEHYLKITASIIERINIGRPSNRIELKEDVDGTYISLSELGKNINFDLEKDINDRFKIIETWSGMDKGMFYEKFCTLFLNDLGLEAETTKATGDKGVDIVASYKSNLNEYLSKFVFFDHVYLLGQAKFFASKVDTPVIRKLVGDSLFLRFDQLNYIQISHNAIHLIVFSHKGFTEDAIVFAEKNKIMRVETSQMISIISASPQSQIWQCYSFLIKQTTPSNTCETHLLK
jgi:hypothetical protein